MVDYRRNSQHYIFKSGDTLSINFERPKRGIAKSLKYNEKIREKASILRGVLSYACHLYKDAFLQTLRWFLMIVKLQHSLFY